MTDNQSKVNEEKDEDEKNEQLIDEGHIKQSNKTEVFENFELITLKPHDKKLPL
jgi:hypothetical protein